MPRWTRFTLLLPLIAAALLLPGSTSGQGPLAPEGVPNEIYYAPFPIRIRLDGDLSDWEGVPTVKMPDNDSPTITFAAAANRQFLYFMADVVDDNIISGQHDTNYWNEDSVEFYINATGDLSLKTYVDGVAQITVPALNIDRDIEDAVVAGVQGQTAGARIAAARTDTGYVVEVSVPLKNEVWEIPFEHGSTVGFQVHLNAASEADRDTKLIWSAADSSDQSYQNPSLFGKLILFEIGQTEIPQMVLAPTATPYPEITDYAYDGEWELVWSDEFEGEAGESPNPDNWECLTGGHGWGNEEWEYYTDRPENVSLDGAGNLVITAREESLDDATCWYGDCTHTSARCVTQGRFEFTYGKVEGRMKLPYGQGIWPAFWMLGADVDTVGWPNSGEIDIMEHIGREPRTIYGTVHGPQYSGAAGIGDHITLDEDASEDYHVFSIEWEPYVIRWYMDGTLYHTVDLDVLGARRQWVYDHDFFLLLNLAVGGLWPGYPDETTEFPQQLIVDWVRVYQRAE